MQRETPESFRSEEGRETFALLTEIRQACTGHEVRDRRWIKPVSRLY